MEHYVTAARVLCAGAQADAASLTQANELLVTASASPEAFAIGSSLACNEEDTAAFVGAGILVGLCHGRREAVEAAGAVAVQQVIEKLEGTLRSSQSRPEMIRQRVCRAAAALCAVLGADDCHWLMDTVVGMASQGLLVLAVELCTAAGEEALLRGRAHDAEVTGALQERLEDALQVASQALHQHPVVALGCLCHWTHAGLTLTELYLTHRPLLDGALAGLAAPATLQAAASALEAMVAATEPLPGRTEAVAHVIAALAPLHSKYPQEHGLALVAGALVAAEPVQVARGGADTEALLAGLLQTIGGDAAAATTAAAVAWVPQFARVPRERCTPTFQLPLWETLWGVLLRRVASGAALAAEEGGWAGETAGERALRDGPLADALASCLDAFGAEVAPLRVAALAPVLSESACSSHGCQLADAALFAATLAASKSASGSPLAGAAVSVLAAAMAVPAERMCGLVAEAAVSLLGAAAAAGHLGDDLRIAECGMRFALGVLRLRGESGTDAAAAALKALCATPSGRRASAVLAADLLPLIPQTLAEANASFDETASRAAASAVATVVVATRELPAAESGATLTQLRGHLHDALCGNGMTVQPAVMASFAEWAAGAAGHPQAVLLLQPALEMVSRPALLEAIPDEAIVSLWQSMVLSEPQEYAVPLVPPVIENLAVLFYKRRSALALELLGRLMARHGGRAETAPEVAAALVAALRSIAAAASAAVQASNTPIEPELFTVVAKGLTAHRCEPLVGSLIAELAPLLGAALQQLHESVEACDLVAAMLEMGASSAATVEVQGSCRNFAGPALLAALRAAAWPTSHLGGAARAVHAAVEVLGPPEAKAAALGVVGGKVDLACAELIGRVVGARMPLARVEAFLADLGKMLRGEAHASVLEVYSHGS
ncbi:hypothetical protein CYMTET_16514 [Cymbomonas tetramitiformis]|uniref:Uncharacterized protein n=1 Tax=Cymbomonas tetramitiformis TaxID=36881 RepID=A0AAE0GC89_9CHLO|nr:hypothetical protein CYMTET_16514 [Cymbomonas tetramitiformis]|eukprot:gene12520-14795_t